MLDIADLIREIWKSLRWIQIWILFLLRFVWRILIIIRESSKIALFILIQIL